MTFQDKIRTKFGFSLDSPNTGDSCTSCCSDIIRIVGPIGATGNVGASGVSGTVGAQGSTGPPGSIGASGVSGMSGQIGPTGVNGTPGSVGSTGASGVVGSSGLQGPIGATGPSGLVGATGNVGAAGPQGIAGLVGDTGIIGNTGDIGHTGATGPSGHAGVEGNTGASGISGLIGATGSSGVSGLLGPSGSIGNQGATGVQGSTGPVGDTGTIGFTGSTGSTGSPGNVGATGFTGPSGNIGNTGIVGPSGASGLMGASGIQGVSGPSGVTGPAGNVGSTGASGVSSMINNTVFVDTRFGNNATAQVENPGRPFATITPAIFAAHASVVASEIWTVIIRNGDYMGDIVLHPNVNLKGEDNSGVRIYGTIVETELVGVFDRVQIKNLNFITLGVPVCTKTTASTLEFRDCIFRTEYVGISASTSKSLVVVNSGVLQLHNCVLDLVITDATGHIPQENHQVIEHQYLNGTLSPSNISVRGCTITMTETRIEQSGTSNNAQVSFVNIGTGSVAPSERLFIYEGSGNMFIFYNTVPDFGPPFNGTFAWLRNTTTQTNAKITATEFGSSIAGEWRANSILTSTTKIGLLELPSENSSMDIDGCMISLRVVDDPSNGVLFTTRNIAASSAASLTNIRWSGVTTMPPCDPNYGYTSQRRIANIFTDSFDAGQKSGAARVVATSTPDNILSTDTTVVFLNGGIVFLPLISANPNRLIVLRNLSGTAVLNVITTGGNTINNTSLSAIVGNGSGIIIQALHAINSWVYIATV